MRIGNSMKSAALTLNLTVFTTLTAFFAVPATETLAQVKSGDPAPDFSLPGHDGKTWKLSDFRGKHVVLEWFNDGCPYVKKHYESKNMQNLQREFAARDVVWLSMISSAPGSQGHVDAQGASELLKKHDASPKATLLDPDGKVGRMFDARTTPHMYIIDPAGKLVYQGAIDDNPSASIKTVATAKPIFAEALRASLDGKPIAVATTKPYGCSVKYAK
jgi:peroxiredoxin